MLQPAATAREPQHSLASTHPLDNTNPKAALLSCVVDSPVTNRQSDDPRTAPLPMYGLSTSRGVPMPLPSAILDVEYPNHPGIVDALCQIRLGDDAPRRGLPSEEARLFTEGWDAENISIYLQPRQPHQQRSKSLGDKAANLPPKTGYDKDIKCCTRESHAPSSSSEHFGTSTTLSANPDLAKEAAFAPASLFISIPTPDSTPDVLIMTPLEGPSEGADPFDDGSVTFALAAAPASPSRASPHIPPKSPKMNKGCGSAVPSEAGLHKHSALARMPEVETALETSNRLIEKARVAATARYDTSFSAGAASSVQNVEYDRSAVVPCDGAVLQDHSLMLSCSSSFIGSSATDKSNSFTFDAIGDDSSDNDSDEEELETFLLRLVDGSGDSRSATSSIATVTQGRPDVSPSPSPSPSPHAYSVLLRDDGDHLPLHKGTKEDHVCAIRGCEADSSAGIRLNRDPESFVMQQLRSCAYNLGPSCSWAPYFFRGRPESGPIVQHGTSGKTPDLLVPYIRQLGVTDSPLALPMGTRIINFLPDFEINSPVRCFLHTSCHGPPPPATPLPILQSLPSFGSATTAAQVTTLPVEPPPVEALEEMVGLTATEEDAIRSPTIAEYATFAGAYKEWTHTCIALHQVAGHITGSQVESAATGLADMIRLLITSAQPMGLLSESAYQGTHAAPFVAPVALYHKQVFWARFVALAFAVLSEHALRVDLVAGGSEWAASVPEPAVMEALIIPDRSQTPTPTPLAGRVFRVDGYLSLDSMVPEHWWRYGRNADTAWDDFLNKFQERYSMPSIYNDKETESPHSPIPKEARLSDASDGADYEGYSIYRDFGNGDDMHSLYGAVYDLAEGQMTGSILTAGSVNGAAVDGDEMRAKNSGNLDDGTKANGDASEDEDEDEYLEQQDQIQDSKGCTVVKGITKAQLVANPASLNLMSQLTAVRVRGGLRALANVIYGEGKGPGCLAAREDADTVLARAQFDMIQAMADDTVHAFERLLHWEPCEGPRSHTGIRTIRQKLSKTYRHPLELYSAVV